MTNLFLIFICDVSWLISQLIKILGYLEENFVYVELLVREGDGFVGRCETPPLQYNKKSNKTDVCRKGTLNFYFSNKSR